MFKDNIAWYDVDSDEEFSIPFLPPLPSVEILCLPGTDVGKEEQSSSLTLSETSEPSSSAPGSNRNAIDEERGQDTSDRFQAPFKPAASNLKNKKNTSYRGCFKAKSPENFVKKRVPKYVCFIGKFPKLTTIDDLKSFVKSNDINFTEIRVGPKKKRNAHTFGYVDLPTKKDYDKLIALNGSFYRRCKIRIDRATRKEPSQHHDAINSNSRKTQKGKGDPTAESCKSRQDCHYKPTLDKALSCSGDGKKTLLNPLQPRLNRGVGCNKVTARSQRWKRIMYDQKQARNNQKYIRRPRFSGAAMNTTNSRKWRRTISGGKTSTGLREPKKCGRVGQLS